MSVKCIIGLHTWADCTCTQCGKIRHEHHLLAEDCEKCSKCGTVIQDQHNWSKDCQKCSKCGKTSTQEHNWKKNCEKCSVCGATRHHHHKLEHGICTDCGNGTFTDEKEGITYKIVKIGNQVVMGENFASFPSSGNFWSYENDQKNVIKYGYLYDWETAKKLAPHGWHLPTKAEWDTLYNDLGGKEKTVYEHIKAGGESGFDGLFGGWRYARGTFNSLAASGHFWSSTEDNEKEAWHFKTSALKGHAEIEKVDKGYGLSVRYFRD